MQNYSQNSNNYFENMLGETANIRSNSTPYFQIFIIPDTLPYYDNGGNLQKWEQFTKHNVKKYLALSEDNIETSIHTPTLTLLYVLHLPEPTQEIRNKKDYIEYYSTLRKFNIEKSIQDYGTFSNSVVFNDYDSFADRLCHYIKFTG